MRSHFVNRLFALAEKDERIMIITGDLGFGVLTEFEKRFPRQYINAGVAEQNMTGLATGLALEGRIVFTYSIANFSTIRCLEQIRNDAAYHEANVKVVAIGGGFSYGQLGFSHQATEDLSIMRSLPNVTVLSPGDFWEAENAADALVNTPGTGYLRIDKSSAGYTQREGEAYQLGQARMLRDGQDVTLIATGGILGEAIQAGNLLAESGIQCRILSMHTIKPLDVEAVRAAALETGGVVTIEEHTVDGGLGGAVAEELLESGVIPAFFYRIGLRVGFSSIIGSQEYLRAKYGMDKDAISTRVRTLVRSKKNQPRSKLLSQTN